MSPQHPNATLSLSGPFDIIGDVHGCGDELALLLRQLGYEQTGVDNDQSYTHPDGRMVVFLGDLADRGPRCLDVLQQVRRMVESGTALSVLGNHDDKLLRWLHGRNVQLTHGLDITVNQIEALHGARLRETKRQLTAFLESLPSHHRLDNGRLVVAHAGILEGMHGKQTRYVDTFTKYGATTGQRDEHGFPIRLNWAKDYHGEAWVVYGHSPVQEPKWENNTVNIDTGCVFGGKLTALRYPEMEIVSQPALLQYSTSPSIISQAQQFCNTQ